MFILLLLWSYLCYCIRFVLFRLIVCYAHVLYSSSLCMVVFMYCIQAHCIVYGRGHVLLHVFKLIIYGRVPLLYSGSSCKVVFMYCIYSGSLCMVMCVFMLFA